MRMLICYSVFMGTIKRAWVYRLFSFSLLVLVAGGGCGVAWALSLAPSPWSATLDCQWQVPRLDCGFRPLAPVQIETVELTLDSGDNYPALPWRRFGDSGATSAILWLVDVSDPAREATVDAQRRVLEQWLPQLEDGHHRVGLAAFAGSFKTLTPIGDDPAAVLRGLESLTAAGHSTAFYQSLLTGLELLRWTSAERKSLWIFSDGIAEDTAYRHGDVVAAAQAAGVMIVGLGYPERESQRPQLQRLQRLAEETGGHFIAVEKQALPTQTLADILAVVDGGGNVSLQLPGFSGSQAATLKLYDSAGGVFTTALTLAGSTALPAAAFPDGTTQPLPLMPPAPAAQPQVVWPSTHWLLIGSGLAGIVLLTLWWLQQRPRVVCAELPLLARFEVLDSDKQLLVSRALCRLGRAPDNDLCFSNDSVSSHHAELQRRRDASFTICDLGSTNGVWVNGERVTSQRLKDGDLVELGEIPLRFWQFSQ